MINSLNFSSFMCKQNTVIPQEFSKSGSTCPLFSFSFFPTLLGCSTYSAPRATLTHFTSFTQNADSSQESPWMCTSTLESLTGCDWIQTSLSLLSPPLHSIPWTRSSRGHSVPLQHRNFNGWNTSPLPSYLEIKGRLLDLVPGSQQEEGNDSLRLTTTCLS